MFLVVVVLLRATALSAYRRAGFRLSSIAYTNVRSDAEAYANLNITFFHIIYKFSV